MKSARVPSTKHGSASARGILVYTRCANCVASLLLSLLCSSASKKCASCRKARKKKKSSRGSSIFFFLFVSVTLPITSGRPRIGIWICEPRHPAQRLVGSPQQARLKPVCVCRNHRQRRRTFHHEKKKKLGAADLRLRRQLNTTTTPPPPTNTRTCTHAHNPSRRDHAQQTITIIKLADTTHDIRYPSEHGSNHASRHELEVIARGAFRRALL